MRVASGCLLKITEEFARQEGIPAGAEISLVLAGNRRVRTLNRKWRGVDRVTDVLSFEGDFHFQERSVSQVDLSLGEIFIALPFAARQAQAHGHSLQKELAVLYIHGLLHLVGYDHKSEQEYRTMSRKEKRLLEIFYK